MIRAPALLTTQGVCEFCDSRFLGSCAFKEVSVSLLHRLISALQAGSTWQAVELSTAVLYNHVRFVT